jgi:DNA-binding transcriptional MerR regulator
LLKSTRTANGYREFDDSAVERVRQIRLLLDLGVPLRAIKKLGPCLPGSRQDIQFCPKIRLSLTKQRDHLLKRAEDILSLLRKLDEVIHD